VIKVKKNIVSPSIDIKITIPSLKNQTSEIFSNEKARRMFHYNDNESYLMGGTVRALGVSYPAF
jgi:hypothetical protein